MKTEFYLIATAGGAVRTGKKRPSLDWNEIAIYCVLDLPNILFQRPRLEASIKVEAKDAGPIAIEPAVVDNIKSAIEQAAGVEVQLTVVEAPKEK